MEGRAEDLADGASDVGYTNIVPSALEERRADVEAAVTVTVVVA